MTTERQPEQSDRPVNPLPSALQRRAFLRRAAIGAGAVAAAAFVPSLGSVGGTDEAMAAEQAPTSTEPMMVYVRDAARGEAVIMTGDVETVVVDRGLVGVLMRAQGRHLA